MTKKTIIFLLLLLLKLQSYGQIYKLKDFIETPIPKDFSSEWHKLNKSGHEFCVDIKNGHLNISKAPKIGQVIFPVSNGFLAGIDQGEWGGKLVFKKTKDDKNEVLIKYGNIKYIFKLKNQIYFLEGLAHLSINKGSLYRLDTLNGSYSPIKVLDLEDSPEAYTIKSDSLLIISSQSFFVIHDFKKDIIIENAFWSCLYPNSMATSNDDILVGVRGGYVKIYLPTKKIIFYKYKH